ncbi:MAG: outer membrane beta-barrel protein [Deltaproteobacteria bacterium]|nr:outer membrane beta-barrel protein [Deltaproteobacteria bacterium]
MYRIRGWMPLLLGVFCLLPALEQAAWGGTLFFSPEAALREECDDNLFYDQDKSADDFLTTLSLGLAGECRAERLKGSLFAGLDVLRYADHRELDDEDQKYRADLSWQWTERLNLSGGGGFQRDSRPDRDLEETGLVLEPERRDRWWVQGGAGYALTERLTGQFSFNYSESDFEGFESLDSEIFGWDLALVRAHDPTLKSRLVFQGGRYESFNEYQRSEVDYYSLQLGVSKALGERWSFDVAGGARYSESEFETTTPLYYFLYPEWHLFAYRVDQSDSDDWGWTGALSVSYRDRYSELKFHFSHDLEPASGQTGATIRTSFGAVLSHRFTEELTLFLSASYHINESEEGEYAGSAIDERIWWVQPRLSYRITDDFSVEAGYLHSHREDRDDDYTSERNLVFCRLLWRHRYPLN